MTPLPTNWENNTGMQVDADFLNDLDAAVNDNEAALLTIVGGADEAAVTTSQTRSGATYGDLTTTGPAVTGVQIGDSGKALIFLYAQAAYGSGTSCKGFMGFAASGANTIAADDVRSASYFFNDPGENVSIFAVFLLKDLSPGSTDFTAKYRSVAGGSASFADRRITVIPL